MADSSGSGTVLSGDFRLIPRYIWNNIQNEAGKGSVESTFAFRHPAPTEDNEDQSDGECNMVFADGRVESVHFSDDRVSSQANMDKMLNPKDN